MANAHRDLVPHIEAPEMDLAIHVAGRKKGPVRGERERRCERFMAGSLMKLRAEARNLSSRIDIPKAHRAVDAASGDELRAWTDGQYLNARWLPKSRRFGEGELGAHAGVTISLRTQRTRAHASRPRRRVEKFLQLDRSLETGLDGEHVVDDTQG